MKKGNCGLGWDGVGTNGEISSAITKVEEGLWAGMGQFSIDSTARRLSLDIFNMHRHGFPANVGCEFIIPHNHGHPL